MAKKGCVFGCGVLLFACVVLTTLCTASTRPKTRMPPVDIYDLMMDVSLFPEGWRLWLGPVHPPERAQGEHGEIEMLYIQFYPEGLDRNIHGADHRVFRYLNELVAAVAFYLDFSGGQFLPWHMITPWALPEEWSYESPIADRFKFACGEVDMNGLGPPQMTCTAVAQHDECISVFSTELSPEYMTLEDVERILIAIDERMASYLEKDAE